MAVRRGRSQARRNQGPGIPGWAWLIAGLLLGIGVIMIAPSLLKSDGEDGFFRPQPDPDAQPATASEGIGIADSSPEPVAEETTQPEYDFYTLLPGEEVALTDAQLAATARAEAEAAAELETDVEADDAASATAAAADTTATPTSASSEDDADDVRYILQAGSFSTASDAETVKARIALLGLVARVEPAQIKDKTMYRVRMGPYGSASALSEAKRKLAASGLPALAIKAK